MDFEQAHTQFIEHHMAYRSGERKGRLLRGHNFAEKLFLQNVWWPLFGNFDYLHPEYEIYDWNRKSQFLDFAFLTPYGRFGLECDGFQSHVTDMDREKFSYSLNRDTFLTGMGWRMIHFSFDDVQKRPEVCRMLLQLVMGPYIIRNTPAQLVTFAEKDLLHLAWNLGRPVRPKDVVESMGINFRTAKNLLQSLVKKDLLKPRVRGAAVRYYELNDSSYKTLL
ncbi:MAG: hypothetical protein P0Y55_18195 [Candidatus Cohnella colombiensis]|uniref:DNA-binding response regulator n=1 Tax=Candidatus Cohnella colombiensis TaxID=3121368 RepID=A0AA95EX17_9BACL|nr:MAG: hypothetical protein P0Y55_18195 [Cohnella sp.]